MLNVQRTIRSFIAAGAKGCTLEDQKWPKKSGSIRGKEVIGMDEHIAKVLCMPVLYHAAVSHCCSSHMFHQAAASITVLLEDWGQFAAVDHIQSPVCR